MPSLHSASKIPRPPSLIAPLQFQSEFNDFPSESLLESFPVLIINVRCFSTSFFAELRKDLETVMVFDGCPTTKSTIPLEFAAISIAFISNPSVNFCAIWTFSFSCPGVGRFPFLFS